MAPNITRTDLERPSKKYPASPFRPFEDFFNDWAFHSLENRSTDTWTPAVDMMEKDGNLLLMVSLPGLNEQDIELKTEGQVLTIQGERRLDESDGCTYHRQESPYGRFSRTFTLPDKTDLGNIRADYKYGILKIEIPQKPEVKPRTIKVNV